MAVNGTQNAQNLDVRVLDYLDDKLQSLADFDTLDSLLDSVKAQQDLLKQQVALCFSLVGTSQTANNEQLSDAKRDQENAQHTAQQHATSIKEKGEAFKQEQGEIDRRLMIVTQSETSDEALQKFESSMERLRRLDVASGYAEMLKEVDTLRYCTHIIILSRQG